MAFCTKCGAAVTGPVCPRCGVVPVAAPFDSLIHPRETIYFTLCFLTSLLIYAVLLLTVVGFLYLLLIALALFVLHGVLVGRIRGNAIKVSARQFPEVHARAQGLARQMGLAPAPEVYVVQAGGLLNAFATRFLGRNFVVVYSDVLELAYDNGEAALGFVLCHELAHIRRRHLAWRWFLFPALWVPLLGKAYARACEYTCDRFGARFEPQGAVAGLLVLAAGKKLYRKVDLAAYCDQALAERGFWVWLAEVVSTHPNLNKRLRAVGAENAVAATAV